MKVTLERINEQINESPQSFIESCEADYKARLCSVTKDIAGISGRTLVMLAGPSGSGKTTTASLLKKDFEALGRKAMMISLDDFYKDQGLTYTFEDGTVDYETVEALDVSLIGACLTALMHEGKCELPHFSFKTKKRDKMIETVVDKDEIIIVEGLHAINPVITDTLLNERMKKIYVSVSSRIYDENEILLTKRDLRFVRRLIRDYHHRNSEVEYTFYLWNGVRKGEDRYLFPFSERADIRINSIHPYEPCVFKDIAVKLLDHVGSDSVYYESALSLKNRISKFVSLPESAVPESSLLNEFMG